MTSTNLAQNYKFGGKEFNDELGLSWLDFHARNYDPALGRWMNIDPLADTTPSWNPYNYVENKPTIATDPTGLSCVGCGPNGEDYTPPEGSMIFGDSASAGPGGPPTHSYSGPGAGVGDVVNVLPEVTLGGSNNQSWSSEGTEWGGSFSGWKSKFGYSGDYNSVSAQYNADWGNSYTPFGSGSIDGRGFSQAFGAGWLGWSPGSMGYDVMNIASGSILAPLLATNPVTAAVFGGGSIKGYGARMAYDFGGEMLANQMNPFDVNVLGVVASGLSGNGLSSIIGAKYSYTISGGGRSFSNSNAAYNLFLGEVGGRAQFSASYFRSLSRQSSNLLHFTTVTAQGVIKRLGPNPE